MSARTLPWFIAALLIATFAGCDRADKTEPRVAAKNIGDLQIWRSNIQSRFTPDTWHEFDAALQEVRWREMALDANSRGGTVDEALCREIDGHTVPEVLRLGYEAKVNRLEPMRAELQRMVDANALVVAKPGDQTAADSLDQLRAKQKDRLQALVNEIEAAKRRLAELGDSAPARVEAETPSSPSHASAVVLSREEALEQINALLDSRRRTVLVHYGEWPITLDPNGLLLKGDDKEKFLQARAKAAHNGHTVIPVKLKGQWWIYDATVDQPEFSSTVTANLTEADRKTIARRWANLQAEAWARNEARDVDGTQSVEPLKPTMEKLPPLRPDLPSSTPPGPVPIAPGSIKPEPK